MMMMHVLRLLFAATALCSAGSTIQAKNIHFKALGVTIQLADSVTAAGLSLIPDAYSGSQTAFDRSIRLGPGTTEQDYLRAAARNVRNWTAAQEKELQDATLVIDAYFDRQKIQLHLPDTVTLIHASGMEEFGAEGWTRQNRIMLNTDAQVISPSLVAHELFHVLSRYDSVLRNKVYAVFGFKPCNNIVYKPAMDNKVITNPDCPFLAHYVTLDIEDKPRDFTIMLYSKSDYEEGKSMQDYIAIGLLVLKGDDWHKEPLMKEGRPVVYELTDIPDVFKKIGTNTPYVLHVEEIAAEHFATLVTGKSYPQPEFLKGMETALQ